jgi:hypothetical protein
MTGIYSSLSVSMRSFLWMCLVWFGLGVVGTACYAEEEPAEEEAAETEKNGLKKILAEFENIEVGVGDEQTPLKFNQKPLLRWPNITRKVPFGGTFIWTRDGRPEVIACIWEFEGAGLWFGIQSLSADKVIARKGNTTFWRSDKPDIEFQKLTGAAPPTDSPVKRLSQMKEFAGRFRARVRNTGKDTEELRLLTTPIYRYTSGKIIDGTLFAFVQGTDPEVILHLEARRHKGEKGEVTEWYYGISRRSVMPLEAMLDDKQIWSVESVWGGPSEPFFQSKLP